MLFEEWYVEREARAVRLAKVAAMSAEKKVARQQGKASLPTGDLQTEAADTNPSGT